MFTIKPSTVETDREEQLNVTSHLVGLHGSLIAAAIVYLYASSSTMMFAGMVFCISSMVTYAASVLYHGVDSPKLKLIFYVIDCSSIYILIASTASSFLIAAPSSNVTYSFIAILTTLALVGIICKIVFVRAHLIIFAVSYVALGWVAMLLTSPFVSGVPSSFIMAGGAAYSIGVIFYLSARLENSHFVWHICVMLGSLCNFIALVLVIS